MEIRNRPGFTLVEIIVSMTILGFMSLCLFQLFNTSRSYSSDLYQREIGLLLAQKKTEHILGNIETLEDTLTVDTLGEEIYEITLKKGKDIPPVCTTSVYVNNKKVAEIHFKKQLLK